MKNKLNLLISSLIFAIIMVLLVYGIGDLNAIIQNKQNQELQNDIINNDFKKTILIPVDVYVIKYNNQKFSSLRNEENIKSVFDRANEVWSQANIQLNVGKIENATINDTSAYYDLNKILFYMLKSGNYHEKRINAYFVKMLHGSNGIAFSGNIIMVADETTVYDFRATSHEIGHVLRLIHIAPVNRLMAMGVNGFELSQEEIIVARKNALRIFNQLPQN